jgi:hypothetical protein
MMGKGGSDSAAIREALDKALADSKPKAVPSEEITVGSGGYKIGIPNHMVSSTELNDEASLQYNDLAEELYIIVIDESKTEFIKTFTDDPEFPYDDKLTPEKNYRMNQMHSLTGRMNLRGTPEIEKATINGLDAEIVSFVGTPSTVDLEIYYKLAFIEGTKKLYMVMTWTLADRKATHEAEMNQMLQSFKLAE